MCVSLIFASLRLTKSSYKIGACHLIFHDNLVKTWEDHEILRTPEETSGHQRTRCERWNSLLSYFHFFLLVSLFLSRVVEGIFILDLIFIQRFCYFKYYKLIPCIQLLGDWLIPTPWSLRIKQFCNSLTPTGCLTIQFYSDVNHPKLASDSTDLRIQSHKAALTSDTSPKS